MTCFCHLSELIFLIFFQEVTRAHFAVVIVATEEKKDEPDQGEVAKDVWADKKLVFQRQIYYNEKQDDHLDY